MAKLSSKDRKKVAKADATQSTFEPLTPGKYVARLSEVEARFSQAGNPIWNITFDEIHDLDGERMPGRQWYNLNLPQDEMPDSYSPSPAALKRAGGDVEAAWASYQEFVAGNIKQFFEAMGYSEDSDTDEMIGERVVLQIGITTIQRGPRQGQQTNQVTALLPLSEVDYEDDDDSEDDEDF